MNLRSGAVVGAGLVPPPARPAFEEGVSLVLGQWTALALAVENEWGGPYSRDKARELVGYVSNWFYGRKEHFPDELEEVLEEALVEDFNVEAEDGSPREVAEALCALHDELVAAAAAAAGPAGAAAAGAAALAISTPRLDALRARAAAAAKARSMSKGAGGAAAGGEGDSSSSGDDDGGSDDDVEMGEAGGGGAAAAPAPRPPRAAPVVDEDGFTVVQGRRRR